MRGFDSARLAALREERGFSQADLARLSGVGRSTLTHWESGKSSPQVDLLAKAARILDVRMEDLVVVPVEDRYPGDYRILCGLTQPQLGLAAGVPTALIGALERGEVELGPDVARKVAAALGLEVEVLSAAHERARRRPPGTPV
ncbi:helix-turn-helix domain-containing protein [Gordonia sp. SID5947]|uniref:helix-turn-helix transcriptional regulator n=1 Tax=Gordonia sp. SID5947 TaxID=2690315 RepID=UPI001367EDAF|nr:helix-turn-helix transcriptional regulator [Gordonia sp. SID5947]MYR08996.1 helix-turn-helix domain-containing protein [Gordonia sp. SID5947]